TSVSPVQPGGAARLILTARGRTQARADLSCTSSKARPRPNLSAKPRANPGRVAAGRAAGRGSSLLRPPARSVSFEEPPGDPAVCPQHPIDDARSRLLRAGWSLGEVCCGARWVAEASRSGRTLQTTGDGHAATWQAAARLAESLPPSAPEED